MVNPFFYAITKKIPWLVEQIPADGCLLVFNANVRSWTRTISDYVPGEYTVHRLSGTPRDKLRDLYISAGGFDATGIKQTN